MGEHLVSGARIFKNNTLKLWCIRIFQAPFAMHRQDFAEVVFVIGGHADYGTGPGFRGPISAGEILFVPSNGKHAYYEVDDLEIIGLLFAPEQLPMPLLNLYALPQYRELFGHQASYYVKRNNDYPRMRPDPAEFEKLKNLLEHFLEVQKNSSPAGDCEKMGLFMCIIGKLCDIWQKKEEPDQMYSLPDMQMISSCIANNCTGNISLEELASRGAMSVSTLLRHFRRAFGTTPAEYLKNLRLDRAATLLQSTSLRVGEIADQCGFASSSYFISVFRKKFGRTPEEFRRKRVPGLLSQKGVDTAP